MYSRHVHILPRIKAYSILLFPSLSARVRGGNNGEICRTAENQPTDPGRVVAPPMRQTAPYAGNRQMCSKDHGADTPE